MPRKVGSAMADLKKVAFDAISRNKKAIGNIGDSVFRFAEVAMQEWETSKLLKKVLTDLGFEIESGIGGFPTAFMAT